MKLWRQLNESSDFRGQPWLGFYNQALHVFVIGAGGMILLCVVWRMVFGEMPPRWIAATALVTGYFVLIELIVQRLAAGWFDALQDTGYVALGAFGVAASVREVQIGTRLLYELDLGFAITALGLGVGGPMFYAYVRSKE